MDDEPKTVAGIGPRLREARLQQDLSLDQASALTGLSISMISKIERGLTSPSVRSLFALSNGLKVPLAALLEQPTEGAPQKEQFIVRAGTGRKLDFGEKRLVKELLSPQPIDSLELLLITLAPGGSTGEGVFSHNGEEGGVVLTGILELWVDDQRTLLYPGDSFGFRSERPHRFRNAADVETRVLWVNTPPIY